MHEVGDFIILADEQCATNENTCHRPRKIALPVSNRMLKSIEIDGHDRIPLRSIINSAQINIICSAQNKEVLAVNQLKQRHSSCCKNSKLFDKCCIHECPASQFGILYENVGQLQPVVTCCGNAKKVISDGLNVAHRLHPKTKDQSVLPLIVPATQSQFNILDHQCNLKDAIERVVQNVATQDEYITDDKLEQEYLLRQECLFSITEYSQDIYNYLRGSELRYCPKAHYMRKQSEVTHAMRSILVDWLVDVAVEYKLHQQTLYLCVNYIDRFLSSMLVLKSKLQLVGITAMFLAAKYEEICTPDISEFVYITEDAYSKKQILRMELMMLRVLAFNMSSPTAYYFCSLILNENNSDTETSSLAQYLTELTLIKGEVFLKYLPSVIASSAVYVAYETLHANGWTPLLEGITSYTEEHLEHCIRDVRSTFQQAAQFPQKAIYRKYNQNRYHQVSQLSPASENSAKCI